MTPQPFSDNFWSESTNENTSPSTPSAPHIRAKKDLQFKDFLYPSDESSDFHDPYSDLSLFLAQKIKKQIQTLGNAKKWSMKIQEELIEQITPEFKNRFPHCRLGVTALRKMWEKIVFYSGQIQHQKEAMTQDGKLNTSFFIKENLKQYEQLKNPYTLQPYHYAHQLAVKISECIAAIDGNRPKLDQLTKTIWAIQRHLLTGFPQELPCSPYDVLDPVDKLIVKTVLEIIAKEPEISQKELEHQVKEALQSLHDLPSFATSELILANISALLAEKLYASSTFHTSFLPAQKKAICHFIRRQITLCKASMPDLPLAELVRRILALYTLACGLPKSICEESLKKAIEIEYSQNGQERPPLNQVIYAFISAECILLKQAETPPSASHVIKTIVEAYYETKDLPQLRADALLLLEIVIWKILSETEELLEKLPFRIGQRIEEEIASVLIDHPHSGFSAIVQETMLFFKKIKELAIEKKWAEIEYKIYNWSIQGEMLCRSIRLDQEAPLLKLISKKIETGLTYDELLSLVSQEYLKEHPELAIYLPQLALRIKILYKYLWYTSFSSTEESSYDRFLKWHASSYLSKTPSLKVEELLSSLEELSHKMLPLLPFDSAHCRELLRPHAFT